MDEQRVARLREQLEIYRENLRILERRKAEAGGELPLREHHQLKRTVAEIERIEAELAQEELATAEAERERQEKLAAKAKAAAPPRAKPVAPPAKPFPWRAVVLVVLVGILIVKPWRWFSMPTPATVVEATATLPAATPRPTATPLPSTSTAVVIVPPMATPMPVPPTPTPAQPVASATQVWDKDDSVMVRVPAGEFAMGSPEGEGEDREHPQHTVYLSEFWIDQTEVTNERYGRCVAAGDCQASALADDAHFNGADQPVVGVSWQDAKAYCAWVGKQLPTEAQWEKAARGTDGRKYPWGNTFEGSKVNFCDANCDGDWKDGSTDDGYQYTAPVGRYPAGASLYGVLDMAGNVWEWCQDWYDGDYYAISPQRDPRGPDSGTYRVVRGASWYDRGGNVPGNRVSFVGFRCVSLAP